METGIHNTSEIGRLRKVLLHRPGQELENLMPEYLERLLFDDIPYLKEAQAEHDAFAQCLRDAGVEVVYLIDLVVNSLTSPEVRQELVTQFLKEADLPDEAVGKAVAEYLSELDDRAMVSAMMAGIRRSDLRKQGGRLSDHLSGLEEGYPRRRSHAQPLLHPRPLRHHRHRRIHSQNAHRHPKPGDPVRPVHL